MKNLDTFQKNCLITGTCLAAEIPSSCSELKAFVIIGSYTKTDHGTAKPSKLLNVDDENLRFWIHKYEVRSSDIDKGIAIDNEQFINSVHVKDIKGIGELENKLAKYIQDFSLLKVGWKVDYPF